MKTKNVLSHCLLLIALLFIAGCSEPDPGFDGTFDLVEKSKNMNTKVTLTTEDVIGIKYMREEEKLARDVYIFLGNKFPHNTFLNIQESEQKHTDAVLYLINFYGLEDPALAGEGKFTNLDLQNLYDKLISLGSTNLDSALVVGAIIEETDIIDIQRYINATKVKNIINVYSNLLDGSENHLRAFVSALLKEDIIYTPRYLSPAVFYAIINDTGTN